VVRDTREVKASGLQGDASPEMIEIIDDDETDPFGDRASDTTIVDVGGRRWVGPVAAAALAAMIGLGVITSASSTGIPKAVPVSTIPPASRTTQPPAPTTTIAPPVVPYYSADPPREFTVQFAEFVDPQRNPFQADGNYQLWATPNATGASGSWFSIHSLLDGSNSLYSVDAYRVQPGDQPMAISHTSTGQSVVQFSVNRTVSITLTAFGWSDPDLVQLAQSVIADDGDVSLADPSLIEGYQLITSVQPWLAVQGRPAEQIFYASNTNPSRRGIGVSVALRPPTNAGGATLDRQIALRFLLDHATPFDVEGHLGVAGVTTGQNDFALASWIAGDHIVTVSAAMSVPELIAIARTVHEVSFEDWNGMQFQAARYNSDNNFGKYQETERRPVSFGTDAAGQDWSIEVSIVTYPKNRELTWQWDDNLFGGPIDDTAQIHTLVDNNRTYVLADLPRAVAATANLTIARDGLDPVSVPFSDTDGSFDRTFSAYAFSEPTTYTAQIVGEDGAVLATWPAS
jgi:hypothetical protein